MAADSWQSKYGNNKNQSYDGYVFNKGTSGCFTVFGWLIRLTLLNVGVCKPLSATRIVTTHSLQHTQGGTRCHG